MNSVFKKIGLKKSEPTVSEETHLLKDQDLESGDKQPSKKYHISNPFGKKKIEEETPKDSMMAKTKKAGLKYWRDNRIFYFVRAIFIILSFLAAVLGAAIVALSVLSIVMYPKLSAVVARILTAGVSLLTEGVIGMFCSALCFFCKCSNAGYLMNAFLSSFSVGFEMLCFSGLVLFFEPYWRTVNLVGGNVSIAYGVDYKIGGNIDDLLDSHFFVLKMGSVLCFIGFFVLLFSTICAAYLIQPINFVPKLPLIMVQISVIIASEFIFIGSWFLSIETFSKRLQKYLALFISVGGAINTLMTVLGILNICKCWILGKVWFVVRVVVLAVLGVACLFILALILGSRTGDDSETRSSLSEQCGVDLLPAVSRMPSIDSSASSLESLSVSAPPRRVSSPIVLAASHPAFCDRVAGKILQSYGCKYDSVTGNEKYCDDNEKVAVDKMALVSDGYERMLAYASGITFGYVLLVTFFIVFWGCFERIKRSFHRGGLDSANWDKDGNLNATEDASGAEAGAERGGFQTSAADGGIGADAEAGVGADAGVDSNAKTSAASSPSSTSVLQSLSQAKPVKAFMSKFKKNSSPSAEDESSSSSSSSLSAPSSSSSSTFSSSSSSSPDLPPQSAVHIIPPPVSSSSSEQAPSVPPEGEGETAATAAASASGSEKEEDKASDLPPASGEGSSDQQ